jgi:hypothetical protein
VYLFGIRLMRDMPTLAGIDRHGGTHCSERACPGGRSASLAVRPGSLCAPAKPLAKTMKFSSPLCRWRGSAKQEINERGEATCRQDPQQLRLRRHPHDQQGEYVSETRAMPTDDGLCLEDVQCAQHFGSQVMEPTNTNRSRLPKATRFVDLRRSTLSW